VGEDHGPPWEVNAYGVDSALAAAVAVPVAVPFLTGPPGGATALGAVLNAGTVLPLIWRRRAPFAVALTVASFAMLVSAYHRPGQTLQYGGLVVIYTLADLGRRWQRLGFFWATLVLLSGGRAGERQQRGRLHGHSALAAHCLPPGRVGAYQPGAHGGAGRPRPTAAPRAGGRRRAGHRRGTRADRPGHA
jgi:hypothetical protein